MTIQIRLLQRNTNTHKYNFNASIYAAYALALLHAISTAGPASCPASPDSACQTRRRPKRRCGLAV